MKNTEKMQPEYVIAAEKAWKEENDLGISFKEMPWICSLCKAAFKAGKNPLPLLRGIYPRVEFKAVDIDKINTCVRYNEEPIRITTQHGYFHSLDWNGETYYAEDWSREAYRYYEES